MCRTDCKRFYNLLRKKNTNVKSAPTKQELETFGKKYLGKRFNTMKKLDQNPVSTQSQYLKWRSLRY